MSHYHRGISKGDRGASALELPSAMNAGAWNGYSYMRAITIHKEKCFGLVDHRFCFEGVWPFLRTVANGGRLQNANGYDVIFTSDLAGLVQLPHDLENTPLTSSYDATTGAGVWWVLTSVSEVADTVIYMWYGKAGIVADQSQRNVIWPSSRFSCVFHGDTQDGGWENVYDSSGWDFPVRHYLNQNAAVPAAAAKIGKGIPFANNNFANFLDPSSIPNVTGPYSIQLIYKRREITADNYFNGFGFGLNWGTWAKIGDFKNHVGFGTWNDPVCDQFSGVVADKITDMNWHFLCGSIEAFKANPKLFLDGAQVGVRVGVFPTPGTHLYDLGWGDAHWADEARILRVSLDPNIIKTEYQNFFDPNNFFSVGCEVSV